MTEPYPEPASTSTKERLKRLLSLAKPQRVPLSIGTAFLLLGTAMGLVYPQAVRVFIDDALIARDLEMIDLAVKVMLAVFAVQAIATGLRSFLFTVAGERIVTQLREDLFTSIMRQEVGFFDSRRTGELTNRLAADTGVLQNTVSVNISMVLRSFATCVGGLALLVYTSPRLTAVMIVIVPPVAIGAVVAGRWIRKHSRLTQDTLAMAGEIAEESIAGVRTVRAFAREPDEVRRYGSAVMESFAHARARTKFVAWFSGIVTFSGFSALAIVLWYGGRLVLDGAMTVGEVTSFLLYTGLVAVNLASLASLWTDFMRAVGSAERVFDLMDREPQIPSAGGSSPESVAGNLSFENVSFTYPSRPDIQVLEDVSFDLRAGERIAIVGPSGGGKSTIASLIPRFYDPNRGRITFDGTDVRELEPTWLRNQIGTVAQEPLLFSTTVRDNIRYGANGAAPSDDAIERAARTANAHDFVMGFPEGYATMVGERGVQLSGGQKQRVAIARAVLRDPKILILDEATSALDGESEHLVKEALERLMQGRTTLIIAHRLSTVRDADRVVVLEHGRIVQSGPHAELMSEGAGLYRRLVEHQFVEA